MDKNLPTTMDNSSILYERDLVKMSNAAGFFAFSFQDFLHWWYKEQIPYVIRVLKRILVLVDDRLSISLLLKTFFVPWHRDNTAVGYGVGIIVRLFFIPIASLVLLIVGVLGVLTVLFMTLLPTLPLLGLIIGFIL